MSSFNLVIRIPKETKTILVNFDIYSKIHGIIDVWCLKLYDKKIVGSQVLRKIKESLKK